VSDVLTKALAKLKFRQFVDTGKEMRTVEDVQWFNQNTSTRKSDIGKEMETVEDVQWFNQNTSTRKSCQCQAGGGRKELELERS
jgi:hypothetical protein